MVDENLEQIALRVPKSTLVLAERVVRKIKKTDEGKALGSQLTRSYVLRRALIVGLEELK